MHRCFFRYSCHEASKGTQLTYWKKSIPDGKRFFQESLYQGMRHIGGHLPTPRQVVKFFELSFRQHLPKVNQNDSRSHFDSLCLHYKRIEDLGENGGMIHEFGSIYAAIVIQ